MVVHSALQRKFICGRLSAAFDAKRDTLDSPAMIAIPSAAAICDPRHFFSSAGSSGVGTGPSRVASSSSRTQSFRRRSISREARSRQMNAVLTRG